MSAPDIVMKSSIARCVMLPMPPEPNESLRGWALAIAIRPLTSFACTLGCTESTEGPSATRLTGTKSLRTSNGSLL
jgi:hypothetical protein